MRAYERLLEYVKVWTTSDEENESCPSTMRQWDLARKLVEEMKRIGISDVRIDEHAYVYGRIPASSKAEDLPVVGYISHMDTAPAFSGENVNPHIVKDYDGGDIVLGNGVTMAVSDYPELKRYIGKSLIVTDGTTLLGGDDKAGISEIMTACERIITDDIRHGEIRIAFTPDEEIGRGADLFDVENFGADYAYTVDGGALGEIEYENFNAASAKIVCHGNCIHPGEGKGKMRNALLYAMEFNSMLPEKETPAYTEGYEGFFHLTDCKGNEEEAVLGYIVRDHDMASFEARKRLMEDIAAKLNDKYGEGTVCPEIKDSYYNMKEKILPHMEIVDRAVDAMKACKIPPVIVPIRGGTDGARLSYMGLPCPNLSTGGHNFHGKFEYIPIESMDAMTDVLVELMRA